MLDLGAQTIAVRARGLELERWQLLDVALLVRDDDPVAIPFVERAAGWASPQARNFHVIPGRVVGGVPATVPSEYPDDWVIGLGADPANPTWVLSVNRHAALIDRWNRLGFELLNRWRKIEVPQRLVALNLDEQDARNLYHLARPGLQILVVEQARPAVAVQLPPRPEAATASPTAPAAPPLSRSLGLVALGLLALVVGGELLIKGAVRLASAAGLSTLVVGLTVVAYGTSAPELAVTIRSALQGAGDLGVGNVLGSNIFNILVILGLSAMIRVLVIHPELVRRDVVAMILASLLTGALAYDGQLSRPDGIILLLLGLGYTIHVVRSARTAPAEVVAEVDQEVPHGPRGKLAILGGALSIAGIAVLIFGARWLVDGGVAVAKAFGISELVVGLTVVAVGTSLPEVATSILATLRGERDIAVGNVIGSSIFNLVWVLGLAATISGGIAVSGPARTTDLPLAIAAAALCWPLLRAGHSLGRWKALLLLAIYGLYMAELIGRGA